MEVYKNGVLSSPSFSRISGSSKITINRIKKNERNAAKAAAKVKR
jgi:hypothetical protein